MKKLERLIRHLSTDLGVSPLVVEEVVLLVLAGKEKIKTEEVVVATHIRVGGEMVEGLSFFRCLVAAAGEILEEAAGNPAEPSEVLGFTPLGE